MKKCGAFGILVVFCFFFTLDTVFAQRGSNTSQAVVPVRLASPLPRNSDWGRALDRLADDWAQVTNNGVRVQIRHQLDGSETEMLSSLSANNIQAALFLSSGLFEICPPVMTLSIPFFIKDEAELDLVLQNALPFLDARVNNRFVVISWAKGGWVNVFSKQQVIVPDDLRRQKIASSPEFKDMNLAFRTMGFQVVETDIMDIPNKLNGDMIHAAYLTPAVIPPMRLHRMLNHMLGIPIAPVMGAIVMNRVTWDRLGQDKQREIIRVTQRVADEFDALTPKITDNAMEIMSNDGLRIHHPNEMQENLWYSEIQQAIPALVGTAFDRDLYNQINRILERSRNGQ